MPIHDYQEKVLFEQMAESNDFHSVIEGLSLDAILEQVKAKPFIQDLEARIEKLKTT